MANKSLFASLTSRLPRADAVNEAGGRAYKLEPKHALAQVAAEFNVVSAFLADNNQRFVAEVEAIEL